ncbi:DNA polymerase, partial [Trifolium medium]|nr:DNA polymerase [Trifolium medium]
CFHCECKRPPDEFLENKVQDNKYSSGPNFNKPGSRQEVSNAWNFDFDDNESDGADVAAFEYADSHGIDKDFPSDNNARRVAWEDDFEKNSSRVSGSHDEEYVNPGASRPRTGFDDFDDEDDIDSYELDTQTGSNSAR